MTTPTGTRPSDIAYGSILGVPVYVLNKTRAWQKAPYNLVLPYTRLEGWYAQSQYGGSFYGNSPVNASTVYWYYAAGDSRIDEAINTAYDKLKSKLYDTVGLGVDLAESRQSLAMVANAATTLGKSFRQLQRGNLLGAAQALRLKAVPKGASVRKSAANNWLEYHFGWTPLVRDIYTGVEVLNNPVKTFSRASGVGITDSEGDDYDDYGSTYASTHYKVNYFAKQGGRIRAITNSGLHSLDQWGLINPAVVAWNVIPFSFVVDWFVNVEQVLSSFSDFAGMELMDVYTSLVIRTGIFGGTGIKHGYNPTPGYGPLRYSGAGIINTRVSNLTAPVLTLRSLRMPSKARAATAISLLIQQFTRR